MAALSLKQTVASIRDTSDAIARSTESIKEFNLSVVDEDARAILAETLHAHLSLQSTLLSKLTTPLKA